MKGLAQHDDIIARTTPKPLQAYVCQSITRTPGSVPLYVLGVYDIPGDATLLGHPSPLEARAPMRPWRDPLDVGEGSPVAPPPLLPVAPAPAGPPAVLISTEIGWQVTGCGSGRPGTSAVGCGARGMEGRRWKEATMPWERRPSELEGGGRARVEEASKWGFGMRCQERVRGDGATGLTYRATQPVKSCKGGKRGRIVAHLGHARAKSTQHYRNAQRACITNGPRAMGIP